MDDVTINRIDRRLKGTVSLPASKSESNRVLIIKSLCPKEFDIFNLSLSNDTILLQNLLKKINERPFPNSPTLLNCNDAGTAARFLLSYTALTRRGSFIITGNERLQQRPVKDLTDALIQMGADISFVNNWGKLPVQVNPASVLNNKAEISTTISSQFASALLLVAPVLPKGMTIKLLGPQASKPYLDMTLDIMSFFGIEVFEEDGYINVKPQTYMPRSFIVEADWSAAAFWYQMAAMSEECDLLLNGLKKNSRQGDSCLPAIFNELGVHTTFIAEGVHLGKQKGSDKAVHFDFTPCPDLFPAVFLTCVMKRKKALLTGLQNLKHKESDRLQAVISELKKFGVSLVLSKLSDNLSIDGNYLPTYNGELINTYNDHRIAMAFAALAIKTSNIRINNPGVVHKSYPGFFDDMLKCQFNLKYS